jgi:hypothetical protein
LFQGSPEDAHWQAPQIELMARLISTRGSLPESSLLSGIASILSYSSGSQRDRVGTVSRQDHETSPKLAPFCRRLNDWLRGAIGRVYTLQV